MPVLKRPDGNVPDPASQESTAAKNQKAEGGIERRREPDPRDDEAPQNALHADPQVRSGPSIPAFPARPFPKVTPFYAIKAIPHEDHPEFAKLGTSFDVASANEMRSVLALGVSPSKIIFANTIKSKEDILFGQRTAGSPSDLDNEPDSIKIAECYPGAHIVIRIKVANQGSVVELSLKSAPIRTRQSIFYGRPRHGPRPEGISFHVGLQTANVGRTTCRRSRSPRPFSRRSTSTVSRSSLSISAAGSRSRISTTRSASNFERRPAQTLPDEELSTRTSNSSTDPGVFLRGRRGYSHEAGHRAAFRNNKNFLLLKDGVYADFLSGIVFDHCQYEYKDLSPGPEIPEHARRGRPAFFDTLSQAPEIPELISGRRVRQTSAPYLGQRHARVQRFPARQRLSWS